MVSRPRFVFPSSPNQYAAQPAPTLSDWEQMWVAWDTVSRDMIPKEQLLSKPIKLRNALIFYLGHIPTFLDIHVARAIGGKPTEPAYFWKIFERGIDPDVENPEQCHAHSEIPESWPPLEDILKFQDNVRSKVRDLYTHGTAGTDPLIAKAMWIGFEHEAMHLETLLYMLIQSDKILPPPGTLTPDFEALAQLSAVQAVENEWFTIPESEVTIGMEDPDNPSGDKRFFGWDVEKPPRSVHVRSFKARACPITNGEYAAYLDKSGKTSIPASWSKVPHSNGSVNHASKRDSVMNGISGHVNGPTRGLTDGKYVRTVYGSVPLKFALDWPVVASYDELAGCAQWMGGRIPTMEEARSIYSYVDRTKSKEFEHSLGKMIPAVNG